MDLQQEWQNMNAEIITKNKDLKISEITLDTKSKSLMSSLLFKLKWKLRWIRIIDLPVLALAFFLKGDIQILLISFFLSYEIFRVFAVKEFNKIKDSIDYGSTTKEVLENNLKAIKKILRIENIFGYIFLPTSAPFGLLFFKLYRYNSFKNAFNNIEPYQLFLMFLLGILLIWVGKKMNDSIFKNPIKDLERKISGFSEEDKI